MKNRKWHVMEGTLMSAQGSQTSLHLTFKENLDPKLLAWLENGSKPFKIKIEMLEVR